MLKIKIKALSINQAFMGRKFKTPKYKAYEKELLLKLKPMLVGKGKLRLDVKVGYANRASDVDNFLKPFLDILQKYYGFDDKWIYELNVEKVIIKKGDEFIEFELIDLENTLKL